MCKSDKIRGFSLLEVLVAFSILSLSLGVVYQIFQKGTRATILSKEYANATSIAQTRLDSFNVTDNPELNQQQGIEDDKYHWQVNIQPLDNESFSNIQLAVALNNITVDVSWNSLGKQRSITLNSLKLLPVQ